MGRLSLRPGAPVPAQDPLETANFSGPFTLALTTAETPEVNGARSPIYLRRLRFSPSI